MNDFFFYIPDLERSSVDTGAAALSAAVFGTTAGAAAFNPLRQYSKKRRPEPTPLTSNQPYRSLTSADCKAPQFPLRGGKLLCFAAAPEI